MVQLRRIAEHREAGAEKEIRKLYKALLKDLKASLSELYIQNSDSDGVIDFAKLVANNEYARFLQEVETKINTLTPQAAAEIRQVVEDVYKMSYQGMVTAVEKSKDMAELADTLEGLRSITPEIVKRAVENPISGLTLDDTLEKNRKEIIYDIKQTLNVGLVNNDRISTMAKNLTDRVDINYRKATRIARTETHRVREAGNNDAANEINDILENSEHVDVFMVKIWRTMEDERVRPQQRRKTKKGWKTSYNRFGPNHMKMEGQIVKANDKFDLGGGVKAAAPGQSGVAGHDINCRCFVEYDLMDAAEFAMAGGQNGQKEFTDGGNRGIIKANRFASNDLLKQHLDKHLKEYGNFTEQQYIDRAVELLNAPPEGNIKGFSGQNGKIYRYDIENNDFAVKNPDGTIATLFKPKAGMKYWKAQEEKHGKT